MKKINFVAFVFSLVLLVTGCQKEKQGVIKVTSYNIRHGSGADYSFCLKEQADFLKSRQADLISLQEVDKKCERSQNTDQPQFFGQVCGMTPKFAKFMDFSGGEYGICGLSKLPVLSSDIFKMTTGSEPRNFPIMTLDFNGSKLLFVPIHFDWKEDSSARLKQANELISELDKRELPVILAGDFNATPNSPTIKLFTDSNFSFTAATEPTFHGSKVKQEDGSYKTTLAEHKAKKEYVIDFVMARSGKGLKLKCSPSKVVNQRELSDHAPVEAVVSWEKE